MEKDTKNELEFIHYNIDRNNDKTRDDILNILIPLLENYKADINRKYIDELIMFLKICNFNLQNDYHCYYAKFKNDDNFYECLEMYAHLECDKKIFSKAFLREMMFFKRNCIFILPKNDKKLQYYFSITELYRWLCNKKLIFTSDERKKSYEEIAILK